MPIMLDGVPFMKGMPQDRCPVARYNAQDLQSYLLSSYMLHWLQAIHNVHNSRRQNCCAEDVEGVPALRHSKEQKLPPATLQQGALQT